MIVVHGLSILVSGGVALELGIRGAWNQDFSKIAKCAFYAFCALGVLPAWLGVSVCVLDIYFNHVNVNTKDTQDLYVVAQVVLGIALVVQALKKKPQQAPLGSTDHLYHVPTHRK